MSTSVDDPTPGRRAAARAASATHRRAEGGPFRYHVCSLEPGGEYEETIVEVAVDGGPRYFSTASGARMTEVSERYVTVRRMSEIRSMHELDLDEMARLEDELEFERPVAGLNPLDDPEWTEFLGGTPPIGATGPVLPIDPADLAEPAEPVEREAPVEPVEPDVVPAEAEAETDDDPVSADADEPTHIGEDVEMTMESDADWTFEQFEAVVAGSTPAPTPVAPAAPAAVSVPAASAVPSAPAAAQADAAPPAAVPAAPPAAPPAPSTSVFAAPAARRSTPVAHAAALQIGLAQGIAFVAHRTQTDKLGSPYIDHPGRVAETFDPAVQPVEAAVAWLHDVLEDTEITAETLREAGVSPEIIDAVQVLTRTPEVSDADYYARIRVHAVARSVKLADIADNTAPWRVRKLDHETQARLAEKYARARAALGDA